MKIFLAGATLEDHLDHGERLLEDGETVSTVVSDCSTAVRTISTMVSGCSTK